VPFPLPALKARVRSTGGTLVRRLGLLPGGEPDGLGEDGRLGDIALAQRVAAFFPEPPRNSYQLAQWLEPLEALDHRHGVVLITQDSRTTAQLRAATSLSVLCIGRTATLDGLVRRGALGLALYVSHHSRNFQFLRFPQLAHAYLGHGESDKAVSASNQVKAYDRVFVAGQAAVDRLAGELLWFDSGKAVHVGRPQVSASAVRRTVDPAARPTVLYAPTWEGAQASMAYSSVATHGAALVRSLLGDGLRVVYRPHPRTGANRRDVAEADAAVRNLFEGEDARSTGSAVVTNAPLTTAFAGADLLVTDISSLAVEWLPTGRPLVVTEPADPGASVAPSPLLDAVPRLTAAEAGDAGALVRRHLEDDTATTARARLADYYLGDTTEGAALERFLDACGQVLEARDTAVGARAGAGR
jgi:hypothetical protein